MWTCPFSTYLCVHVVSSKGVTHPERNISQPACAIITPLSIQNLKKERKSSLAITNLAGLYYVLFKNKAFFHRPKISTSFPNLSQTEYFRLELQHIFF